MRRLGAIAVRIAAITAAIVSLPGHAESLGTYGNVWSIAEPDAIDTIRARIRKMYADGSMDALLAKWKRDQLNTLEAPPPVRGIVTATRNRTTTFDPTVVVNEPIRDQNGRILVMPGTRINPLDYAPLRHAYVFVDGRDTRQVQWAKARLDADPSVKVILTAGRPLDLSRQWKRQVWFDQGGRIVTRMGIHAVPAMFRQNGHYVEVREIADY